MPAPPFVSGVVLAAGRSQRFGGAAKQLLELDGEPLVRRAVRQALASRLSEVLVVVGHQGRAVARAVADLEARVVENPAFARGQSSSVRIGLTAVSPGARAALFLPCDQPFLTAPVLDRLLDAYAATCGPIVLPSHGGRRGAPVLFDRSLFAELSQIEGDRGGRQLLAAHPEGVVTVPLESELPLLDVDQPGDLERLVARAAGG